VETQIIQGHRKSNEGGAIENRAGSDINIELSAPKYSKYDEKKDVYVYPKEAPKIRNFESEMASKRIQIRSRLPEKMPNGGYTTGREFYIQFKSGKFRTSNVEEIVVIENCSGYGVSVWDSDALVGVAKKARINAAIKAAEDDPEILEALKVKFDMKDFIEPEPEQPKVAYEGGAYNPIDRPKKKG